MTNNQTPTERLFIPALASLYDRLAGLAYPLVRVVAGLWLMPHGAQKLFGWFGGSAEGTAGFFAKIGLEPALPLVYLVGIVEFFGGLLLVVGLLTRPAAVAVFVVLFVATFKVHMANGFFIRGGGYEYAMMWMFLSLAVAFRGGGALSVDARLGKEF
jgi:putative oxidoreductase